MDLVLITVGHHFLTTQKSIRVFDKIISVSSIHHLRISNLASFCLPTKFCIALVFNFPWLLQLSQEKLKTVLLQTFGGVNKANNGECEEGEYELDKAILFTVRHLRISHHTRTCLPQKFAQPLFFLFETGKRN